MAFFQELIKITKYKNMPRRPKETADFSEIFKLNWIFEFQGERHTEIHYTSETVTEEKILDGILPVVNYINHKYDCSDFKALWLLKLYIAGGEKLYNIDKEGKIRKTIQECLTSFKYWISDSGDDSMCYYSENHQMSFAVVEYLTGQYFEDIIFCDNMTGIEHKQRAKNRIELWTKQRLQFGYSEFLSHNYLPINIASISLMLRYGKDRVLNNYIKKALDLLFYDYALQIFNGTFIGPQGRAYPRNNMNCANNECNSDQIIDYVWNLGKFDYKKNIGQQCWFFTTMMMARDKEGNAFYEVPKEIFDIGKEKGNIEIKKSAGLDFNEMKENNLIGSNINSEMFQLGMGALSNPEIIENSVNILENNDMWRNSFISYMKFLSFSFIKKYHLAPKISKKFNLFPNGMALTRHNIYTYKSDNYKLSTLQKYKPGSSGAQQTTMALSFEDGTTVFTHHPLRRDKVSGAPSYWAGYGVAPDAIQNKNIALIIHKLPKYITLAPKKILSYTHTYFPTQYFDDYEVRNNYAFAKKGMIVFALIGKNNFELLPYEDYIEELSEGKMNEKKPFDLVQRGRKQFTIYEVSTIEKEKSFEEFKNRIQNNKIVFDGNKLEYNTNNEEFASEYNGEATFDNIKINTNYPRYSSKFGFTQRNDKEIKINNKAIIEIE